MAINIQTIIGEIGGWDSEEMDREPSVIPTTLYDGKIQRKRRRIIGAIVTNSREPQIERFESADATHGCWDAQAPSGVAPKAENASSTCDQGRLPAGRTPDGPGRVVRIHGHPKNGIRGFRTGNEDGYL